MTPDDVARYRAAAHRGTYGYTYDVILDFCDALEAAWRWHQRDSEDLDLMRERAEQAEAKYADLNDRASSSLGKAYEEVVEAVARAERAEAKAEQAYLDSMDLANDRTLAEAALARVQALCDFDAWGTGGRARVDVDKIRAAIEGDKQ